MRRLFKRVLVAYDGSSFSWKALLYACRVVKATGGTVRALYVVDASRARVVLSGILIIREEELREAGMEMLKKALRKAKEETGVDIEVSVRVGHPVEEILEEAKEWKADLIVVGARGTGGFRELILGSVAESLVRYSPIPVLIIK